MNAATKPSTEPTTGPRVRNQRYRAKHRRIDYFPSPAAQAAIDLGMAAKLSNCLAGTLDALILAGHRAKAAEPASGNSGKGAVSPGK